MSGIRLAVRSAVLAALLIPAVASAQPATSPGALPIDSGAATSQTSTDTVGTVAGTVEPEPEKARARSPFGFTVSFSEQVGAGTFVADEFARTPTIGSFLMLQPSYRFSVAKLPMAVSVRQNLFLEHTRPDNMNGRRFSPMDTQVSLVFPGLYTEKVTGITLTAILRYSIPISYESRFANSLGTPGAMVNLSRSLYGFDLSFMSALNKGLFLTNSRVATRDLAAITDGDGRSIVICRGGEAVCGSGGMNQNFSIWNNLGVRYNVTSKLSLGISYMLMNSFRYAATDEIDEFTAEKRDSNGNRVAKAGMGRSDSTFSSLDADYAILPNASISFAIQTFQPAMTRDNKSFRFPFFDTRSYADNLTSYTLGVNASF